MELIFEIPAEERVKYEGNRITNEKSNVCQEVEET
jgi:hypothetical protein